MTRRRVLTDEQCREPIMIRRYVRVVETPDEYTYDVLWIDRTTGRVVLDYDGADPANTNPDYGATPDRYVFANRGLDIDERVSISACLPEYRP